MLAKLIIIIFLIAILYCLGSGLFFLVRENNDSDKIVKALTWRIVLSLILFVSLFLAYWLGWVKPHGLGM